MDRDRMRRRFERLAAALADDEDEARREAGAVDPGLRLARGLRLSQAGLPDYRRLLAHPGFAQAEDERGLRKADLHEVWRRHHDDAP